MVDQKERHKKVWNWVNELKNMGPKSDKPIKFIVDKTPFDDEDETPPSSEDLTITGRILPNSDLYNTGAFQIEMILGPQYPFKPPQVRFKTPTYHPNIDKAGVVSIDLLSGSGTWKPTSSLAEVVEEVTKIIDKPSLDYILYPEAASLYNNDNAAYRRAVTELFQKHRLPRN